MAFIGCTLQASSQFYAARMPAVVVLLPGLQRGNVQSERPVMSQCPRIRLSRSKTCDQLWHFNSCLIPDTGIIRSFEFASTYSPHSARTFGDSNGPSQAQWHLYFEAVAAFLSLEQVHPFKQTTPCGSFLPATYPYHWRSKAWIFSSMGCTPGILQRILHHLAVSKSHAHVWFFGQFLRLKCMFRFFNLGLHGTRQTCQEPSMWVMCCFWAKSCKIKIISYLS